MSETSLPGVLRWRDWPGSGLEHVLLRRKAGYVEAQSAIISGAAPGFAAFYSVKLDSDWRLLEFQASVLGLPESIHQRRTQAGEWFDRSDRRLLNLDAAADADLSITPFTNTLPIRRLRLSIGESAEITAAYIAFPQLTVSADPQRYTRLSSDRYRYESLDSDFVREISVDEHGFVITYPDLFQRVW